MSQKIDGKRRRLIGVGVSVLGVALAGGVSKTQATQRILTPRQSMGPFYPVTLPLDQDNDLVTVAGRSDIASGEIVNVVGRVLDQRGRPVPDARIEIWQCDFNGRYHHPGDRQGGNSDPNFQGYGHYTTGTDGAYRFRTIKPVPYPGRAPHIHFAIRGQHFETLVTQMYVTGAPENNWDFLLNNITDPRVRQSLLVSFKTVASSGNPELVGNFDIVMFVNSQASL